MSAKDHPSESLYRSIDANLNRAGEGLRVVEDVFRFSLNDKTIAIQVKQLRHLLATQAEQFPREKLIRFRDSQQDVGRGVTTKTETERVGFDSLIRANMVRAAQSIRSLEEHAKLIDAAAASAFEALRYQVYDVQKAAESFCFNCQQMNQFRLCVLTDCWPSESEFCNFVRQLLNGGQPMMIQLRDKSVEDSILLNRGRLLSSLLRTTDSIWIMNDRADLALACEADGVHVGQDDLPVNECRRIIGSEKIVGVSTHHIQQVEQAITDGASYLGVGPVFASQTKSFDDLPGLDFVGQVANATSVPTFAIGGIDRDNVAQVRERGISRIAISHALRASTTISDDVEFFCNALNEPKTAPTQASIKHD